MRTLAVPSASPSRPSSPRPLAPRPLSTLLPALLLAMLLGLLVALGALGTAPARAEAPRAVSVVDEADVLNDEPLADRLREISFREPVDLVVTTLDVQEMGASPSSDIALNDATLELARREHPEWLSADGTKWADGLVVIAIDPGNRFLGTYAGEDVKLSESQYEDVQDAMRDHARSGAWDDAMVDGAQAYADLLGRPWYLSPGTIVVLLVVIGGLAAGVLAAVLAVLSRRRTSRRIVAEARERYDDVMLHYAETELAARTIPLDSPYGEPILQDYEAFRRTAARATALHERIPRQMGITWGASSATAHLAQDYAHAVRQIDSMDDEIVAANDLLNRSNAWHDAWQRELMPLQSSLDEVDGAVRAEPDLADSSTARGLREVAAKVRTGMRTTTLALQNEQTSPQDALAELDRMTDDLARATIAHRDAIIAARARDEKEAEVMREAGELSPENAYGTLRQRRFHYHRDRYPDYWSASPVLYFASWSSAADHDLDTYRNPPDTSSSSGYSSSSSGGFSGSGSSSSF